MIDIASGHPAIDRYLADGYGRVRGMSSRFSAGICGHLIRRQSELGVAGSLAEIGTFEGRFFIAMALGLAPGEIALGIDHFSWPNDGVEGRFLANCAAHGVARERFAAWKADSRDITAAEFAGRLGQKPLRFVHIDSHHSRDCLTSDLELVHPLLHPQGIVCLDDMLHPGYPMMTSAVFDYFTRHPGDAPACRHRPRGYRGGGEIPALPGRRAGALPAGPDAAFARFQFTLGADMESYLALVLTPNPRLAEVE